MTNEKAIKWLESIDKKYIHGGDEWYDEQRHEAIKTAIKTLEERPQGEWNILQKDDNGIHEIECPFCKYSKGGRFTNIGITFHELPYFCECCGADMRVKDEV